MGLFEGNKFKPTPLNLMDTETCSECKCLMMKGWAQRVETTTIIGSSNNPSTIRKTYCLRCKPSYDIKYEYYDNKIDITLDDKPIKIRYFKNLKTHAKRLECTIEGEEIVNQPD